MNFPARASVSPARVGRHASIAICASAAIAILLAVLILLQLRPFNGPAYFPWTYALTPTRVRVLYGLCIAAHVAVAWWGVTYARRRWLAIAVITLSSFGLRVGLSAIASDPPGMANAAALVQAPFVGSFFSAAEMSWQREWTLADYPTLMPQFPLHAKHKAPAPMLFWTAMLHAAGGDANRAATWGVLLVGAASALAVPLAAAATVAAGLGVRASRHAAALTSLAPGAILFFPLFDPFYLAWSLAMIWLWFEAVARGRATWAIAFGVLLASTFFVVFNVLPIGAFLAAGGAFIARRNAPSWPAALKRCAVQAAIAIGVALVGVILLQLVLGYDTLATLHTALEQQAEFDRLYGSHERPYPITVKWDLYDAALGVAFAPAALALAACFFHRARSIAICGLATWLILAVGALLPAETARVWAFAFPCVLLPAAAMLTEGSRRATAIFYVSIALVLWALATSMIFIMLMPTITVG